MKASKVKRSGRGDEKGREAVVLTKEWWVKWNTRRDGTLNFLTATRNIVFRPDLYFCTRTQKK